MSKAKIKALCRYCSYSRRKGLVPCGHCNGWRNPSRKAARSGNRKTTGTEQEAM